MALIFLLIVSMPVGLVSVQDPEEHAVGPGIAADRPSGRYIKGEAVGVYCSSEGLPRGGIFYLCKVEEVSCLTPKLALNSSDDTRFVLTNVSVNVSGMYVCIYQVWRSGIFTNSTGRETVNINVTEQLPAAGISMDLSPSADPDSRTLQCSSPPDFPVTVFQFYQMEEGSVIDATRPLHSDPSAASHVTRAITAEGNYTCQYKVNSSGIVYTSPSSQSLEVLIFDDGQLRLTSGRDACSGRLEVWHWGRWGTVCRAGWGPAESEVVCQHLGCGFTSWGSHHQYYRRATEPIWLRKVVCQGTELSLWSCSLWSYNTAEYCSHRSDVEVSCIGQPKEPSVSTVRSAWGFIEGENITIQCTCPPLYTGSTFHLTKVNQPRFQLTMVASTAENKVTFIIPNGTISQSGFYLCLYQLQRHGVTYNSTAFGITIKVHEIASMPRISLDRWTGIYLIGETPVISCAGLHLKPDGFYLYETTANPVLIDELSLRAWRASFALDTKNRTGEFRYMCTYRVAVANHYVNSTASSTLRIVVTGDLPKPRIYLESAIGSFAQYRKVTCSIVSPLGRPKFYLYKAGRRVHFNSSTVYGWTSSSKFLVSNLNKTNSGTYTCRYQVEGSGRVINSPWSEPMKLDIGASGLRLVNGTSRCSGRLEISYGGEWGRVLDGSWDFASGDAVCEDLGCGFISGNSSSPHKDPVSWNLPRKTWLDGIQCQGTEPSVWDCVLRPHVPRSYWNVKSDTVLSCSALPMGPSLSLERETFLKGNSVRFRCRAYRPLRGLIFYLGKVVKRSAGPPLLSQVADLTTVLTLDNVTAADEGSYACWYQFIRDGHQYNSSISHTVGITVTDHPAKPSITQNRQSNIYLPGETARFRCLPPYPHTVTKFALLEAGEENVVREVSPNGATVVSFDVPLGMKTGYRNYTCAYTVQTAAGHYHSDVSDVLHLIVTDRVPPPQIGIKPSTALPAFQVTVTCTATCDLADSTFYLYKEGEDRPVSSTRAVGGTANFRISKMRSSNRGYYTCRQQVRLGTQLFNSTHSDRLNVTSAGDNALRLAAGANNCSGRVEVFYDGVWGTVCNHSWDVKDGNVVCRHLGCGFVQSVPGILAYGRGWGPIWLKNVVCTGTESSLWLCSLDSVYRWSSCQHNKDAAVRCAERPERPYFELSRPARLFLRHQDVTFLCSAPAYFSGTSFQLYKDGELADMSRVTAVERAHSVTFSIVNVSEASGGLYSCGYAAQQAGALHNSSRSSDVNVTVVDQLPEPGISLNREILLPGENVEVRCIPPSYLSITGIGIRMSKANVTVSKSYRRMHRNTPVTITDLSAMGQYIFSCNYGVQVKGRHLNSSWGTEAKATVTDRPPKPNVTLAQPSVRFQQFLQVTCQAPPAFAGSTFHLHRLGDEKPGHSKAASRSSYTAEFTINNLDGSNAGNYTCWYVSRWLGRIYTSQPSEHLRLDTAGAAVLRLWGGSNLCSGELQIQHKRQWGHVCDVVWTLTDSEVTCRHLGCGFASELRWPGAIRKPGVPLVLSGVHCVGTETSLWQCSLSGAATYTSCSHSRYAAVNCTMKPERPVIEQERAGAFIAGEVISLRCTARTYYAGSTFYLRKPDKAPFVLEEHVSSTASSVLFSLPNARVSDGGLYSCFYQVQRDGKSYNSMESIRISVRVSEQPPQPTLLSSDRSSGFLVGEEAQLHCRTPLYRTGRHFQLHSIREGGYVSEANFTHSGSSFTFTLTNLMVTSVTNYSCRYTLVIAGRLVPSMFSNVVSVIVTDDLPTPQFSFLRSSPTFPLETEATCSIATPHQGGRFYLYKVGDANYTETKSTFGRGRAVYFRLPDHNPGNYTCQYQVSVSGRRFISAHSKTLHVPSRDAMQLRLTGGTDGCSGRLEVSYNGQWRRFCNPYWLLPHAEVLCRYLDCGFAASTQSNSSYLPWRGLTVMSWGRCIGSEIAPWSCPVPSSRRYQKWCDVYAECSDHPSSPKIDLRRLNGRFVVGETINVPCSTHSYVPNATFYLRKSGALEDVPAVGLPGYQGTATFRLADANRSHEGNYSCMYRVSRGGSTYNSTWSSNVEIFVSDHAAEPQLRVIRDPPRFLPGEWVTVSCSAPANVGWSTFYLAIGQQRLAKFSRLPTATFRVDSLVTPGVYNCSCKYQLEIPGKTLNSTASGKVQITVTDQLQKPSLTRAPGDAGRPIPIRCEAHVGLSHLTFHLSRNSRDQILGPMRAYGRRTYYIFPLPVAASDDDNDYYTCRYSIQSGGRTFTSAESDPLFLVAPERAPEVTISLSRPLGSFVQGETVEFRCTTSRYHQGCKYFLYKLGEKASSMSQLAANSTCNATFVMENVTRGAQGNYTCGLQMGQAAGIHNSSSRVELTLTDHPIKPFIAFSRSPTLYVKGENVFMACSAPHFYHITRFYFNIGEQDPVSHNWKEHIKSVGFIQNVTESVNCSCKYESKILDDYVNSTNSETVQVTVTDNFPKPILSMEASSRSLFPGERIVFSCKAPADFEVVGFYLRRNGGEDYVAMKQPLAFVTAANVTLADVNQSDEGNYSCFYRVAVQGELRTSQSSDQLQVILSERLQLRLEQRCLGRVEIYYEKRWGSICGSSWDLRDSAVVCRQLDCGFAESAVPSGPGTQPALLGNVGCRGTESALWDCLSDTWGARNCSTEEYAGVVCNEDYLPKAMLTVLRKSQVFLRGETLNVTCTAPIAFSKMTMYLYQNDGPASEALMSAQASEDTATFTVRGVNGTQSGNYTCVYEMDIEGDLYTSTQSEAISITVRDHAQQPIIYGQGPFDTFLRGHGLRIECRAPYELEDLRFYLFKDGGYERSAVASQTATFWFRNISQENEGNFTCLYQVGIAGKVQNTSLSDPLEVTVADVVSEAVNLRLSSGPSPCSGRLEVFYNGAWGTVCKDGWGIANGDVVCRDLSCGFAALSTDAAVYGEGRGPIWLHNVRCSGTESSFWLCSSRSHQAHTCTHSDDVGVSCTDSPPPPLISLNRPSGVFLPGDTITVQCATHSHYRLAGFHLSSLDGEGPFTFQRSGGAAGAATFTALALNVIEQGRYRCHYGVAAAPVRTINSTLSESVLVTVAYVPVNPSLSVDSPLSEFFNRDSLALRCTIPMYRVSSDTIRFQLHQLSQPLVVRARTPPSPLSSTVFTISSLTASDGGDYACLYQVQRSGRTFNSSYSNPVTVTISDHSNNPTMSLARPSGVFVPGENVDLTCTSPIRDFETEFCLLKVGRGASPTCVLAGTAHQAIVFTLSNVHVTEGGSYACTYEMRKDRKVYKSKASNEVTVSIIEMLPQPSISLSPRWPFFLEGELTSIRCIAPEEHAAFTCYLGRANPAHALRSINPGPDGHLCNFVIEKVQLRDEGDYSCHYQADISGRMVDSRFSVTLHLAVRARPAKPSISASYLAASREYLVNCTSPLIDPAARIYLYRTAAGEAAQVTWAQVTGASVVFRLSNVSSAGEGNYTCLSETTEAGRAVRSPLSEGVALPTPGSASQLSWVGFAVGAAIGLLVTLLLTAAYCRIRGHCKFTADSDDLQTHLLLSPHEPVDVRDYMDLETRL